MSDSENVMTAERSATARPTQLDVDDKFLLLLEQMQQMNSNITASNPTSTTHLVVESLRLRLRQPKPRREQIRPQ